MLTGADCRGSRAWAAAITALALIAALVWFFVGRDGQDVTARLTADAYYYHVYLPSLVLDRDLDFTNEYRITQNWYRLGQTSLGRPANVFGIGPAIFELPFFLVGHGIAQVAGLEGNGFSGPEIKATLLASLLFSFAALFFAYRLIQRRLGGVSLAVLVPLLVALASPVVYYAIRQPGYAHPFATFWIAWLIDAWDRSFCGSEEPRSMRTWLLFGALLGLAALARPQVALWGVLFLWAAMDDLSRSARARMQAEGNSRLVAYGTALAALAPRWLPGAALAILCIVPQSLAWKGIYGAYYLVPQGPGFMRWDAPAWSEVLFSSRNGLFPWSPLYALAALGLVIAALRTPRLGGCLILGVALQAIANGASWDWWAGGSFGGRRFDSCYLAFAYGFACLVIWPAQPTLARRWLTRGMGAVVLLIGVLLAAGNVVLAGKSSAPSVPIYGGRPAAQAIAHKVPGRLGKVVARMSSLANWPARAVFAHRYGTDLDRYDYVVGVHELGELYPGLNSFKGKTYVSLDGRSVLGRAVGLAPGTAPKTAVLTGSQASVLVGFNRLGTVEVGVRAGSPPGAQPASLRVLVNGEAVAHGTITGSGGQLIKGTAAAVRRGTNELTILAPPGTVLYAIELRGSESPLGASGKPSKPKPKPKPRSP